jgi:hypothetical protein
VLDEFVNLIEDRPGVPVKPEHEAPINGEEFARHLAADAKVLDEDPETGAKKYRYVRTGEDHYSLACTYALMASTRFRLYSCPVAFL